MENPNPLSLKLMINGNKFLENKSDLQLLIVEELVLMSWYAHFVTMVTKDISHVHQMKHNPWCAETVAVFSARNVLTKEFTLMKKVRVTSVQTAKALENLTDRKDMIGTRLEI